MRRVYVFVAVLALVSPAVQAEMIGFAFPIDVNQTVPMADIPAGLPTPFGDGVVYYNTDTNFLEWTITYQDLTGMIVSPGAHFHGPADYGQTAGVQIFLSNGNPPEPATGVLQGSTTLSETQEAQLLQGLWYVNIHTAANGPGEIRGQVVPEPASFAMLAIGAVVLLRRR